MSETTTIISAIRTFLSGCPLLSGELLNVDFLPEDASSFSVDTVPVTPILKAYLDGSSMRQFIFSLSTRTAYGEFIRQQLDNLGFFEELTAWMEGKARARELPALGDGRTAHKLEVTTSGYIFSNDTETARYQLQCRLTYFQSGNR